MLAVMFGIAGGWGAEKLMTSHQGFRVNLSIMGLGTLIGCGLFATIGLSFGGVIGYLSGGLGACLLIGLERSFRGLYLQKNDAT